jgi:flagellar basal-body rod protein FlgB
MIGKLDQALSFQSTALKLRSERQQMLSANIANADTPNYKAVDFDFKQALSGATGTLSSGQGSAGLTLATTSDGHSNTLNSGGAGNLPVRLQYRTASQGAVDGNTVEMDAERAQFAENAVRYEAALKFLNGQIKTMLSAVQG